MGYGTTNEGRALLLRKSYRNDFPNSQFRIGLYTNPIDNLNHRSLLANVAAVSGTGYAPVDLLPADYIVSTIAGANPADDIVRLDRPNVVFASPIGINWGLVTGAYVYDAVNAVLIHWCDGAAPYPMANGAQYLVDWLSDLSSWP